MTETSLPASILAFGNCVTQLNLSGIPWSLDICETSAFASAHPSYASSFNKYICLSIYHVPGTAEIYGDILLNNTFKFCALNEFTFLLGKIKNKQINV